FAHTDSDALHREMRANAETAPHARAETSCITNLRVVVITSTIGCRIPAEGFSASHRKQHAGSLCSSGLDFLGRRIVLSRADMRGVGVYKLVFIDVLMFRAVHGCSPRNGLARANMKTSTTRVGAKEDS